ncbi:hypothetical protein C5Z25_11685 [Lactobacillus sp. CBA3605]|nr:hypothetical protein C5Z25_11685 [Lactobacillus sp. CBA3605]
MKAYLYFNRFSVRGLDKVRKEAGIVVMALNIRELTAVGQLKREKTSCKNGRTTQIRLYVHFHFLKASYFAALSTFIISWIIM